MAAGAAAAEGGAATVRAVYLGMAMDVMAPLLLEPRVTGLFAIDRVDDGYAGVADWDGQKDEIRKALEHGSDLGLAVSACYRAAGAGSFAHSWDMADGMSESDDGRMWELAFRWRGRSRKLRYWHHRDFREPWPDEIAGVGAVFCMGADLHVGSEKKYPDERDDPVVVSMLAGRTARPWRLWSCWRGQDGWKMKVARCGKEREGSEAGWVDGERFLAGLPRG